MLNFVLTSFLITLTIMSSRNVYKQRRSFSIPIVKPSSLLATILIDSTDIPFYFNYINRGFPSYKISPLELFRCIRCIQSNKFGCDIIRIIPSQFQNIMSQYTRLESELEEALAKVFRLQQ